MIRLFKVYLNRASFIALKDQFEFVENILPIISQEEALSSSVNE